MKGAPEKLSAHDVANILKVAEAMIKKADAQKEIMLPMILLLLLLLVFAF